jgi:glyceraldehyde 3-phosphate dehydrogenase
MSPPVKCLLNGNGRIGRLVFRYVWDDPTLDIVAINDLCSCQSAAYLLKYDSVHGTWDKSVEAIDDTTISIDGKRIRFSQQKNVADIDVQDIDLVMECTGKFLTVQSMQPYFDNGIKQVVVSAPVKETGSLNVVLGCNHEKFLASPESFPIITNASCTTNCLAPVVKVIQENFGIKHGCITTIHVSKRDHRFLWTCISHPGSYIFFFV